MLNYEISELTTLKFKNFAVAQYFRMNELINYTSHITHKILPAIIIGIVDKFKIIIVIGDKKYWTDNANPYLKNWN